MVPGSTATCMLIGALLSSSFSVTSLPKIFVGQDIIYCSEEPRKQVL